MGKCILLGFHSGGSSTQTFEQWAKENLLSVSTPAPATTPYSTWAKQNFVTSNASGIIPSPASETKAILIEWAKQNFIRLTV